MGSRTGLEGRRRRHSGGAHAPLQAQQPRRQEGGIRGALGACAARAPQALHVVSFAEIEFLTICLVISGAASARGSHALKNDNNEYSVH